MLLHKDYTFYFFRKVSIKVCLIAFFYCSTLFVSYARPVSYPEGTTLMLRNNRLVNSLHLHYSPTRHYSLGYLGEYWSKEEFQLHNIQWNVLAKRWNEWNSQANLYFMSGLGLALLPKSRDKKKEEKREAKTYFIGLSTDFETRRWYLSYKNRYREIDQIDSYFSQSIQIGLAPYLADYKDWHTWFMLEALQRESVKQKKKEVIYTAFLRFFRSVHLMELGVDNRGAVIFNWIVRF